MAQNSTADGALDDQALRPSLTRGDLFALAAIFATVESGYHLAGLRFDASWLDWAWQFLDPAILRRDLIRGVFYLHSQPPAFNLFLGVVLKVAGSRATAVYHAVYLAFGFALQVGLFVLMRRVAVSRRISMIVTTFFAMSPATVALEHTLFYELPVAVLVVWAAVGVSRFADQPSYGRGFVLWMCLAALCLTRSLFHVTYFVAVMALVVCAEPGTRSLTLRSALLPFAAVLALYLKNAVVFGFFGASSWLGMSLARMTVAYAAPATIERLLETHQLSAAAAIEPFSPIWMYPLEYRSVPGFVTHFALTAQRKSSGAANFNQVGFLKVSRDYVADAIEVLRTEPSAYGAALAHAWHVYFWSGTDTRVAEGDLAPLRRWIVWWDACVYGRWSGGHVCLALLIGLPFAWFYAARRSRQHLVWAFVTLTIGYVAVVGNAMEVGENNRFRFATDALSVAALAAAGQAASRLRFRMGPV